MEEKNNLIENEEPNFMDGFKYEAKSAVGSFFVNFLSFGSSGVTDQDSDSSLKEQLEKFLSSKRNLVNINSVHLVFKKLIEQNCVIGEETLKYLCDLCKKENQDKNSVENQENKENNEKGNQNENGVENQLILTLLKTEYVYTDEEDKKQKIRKCVLTDSLFKKVVDLIDQKDFGTKENAGYVFQLVGNIIGGFLSQKNKVSYGDILGLVSKFGFDATVKVLIDFLDKGDSNAVTVKVESLVVDNSICDKLGKMFPGLLTGYQSAFKNVQNNKPGSIALKGFIGYICTFYNDLTCNDQIKNDKDKLKLHRQFIFSILEKTLLKVQDNASEEEKKLMASWSDKIKSVVVGKEEKNNLDEKNIINEEENNMKEMNVIKDSGNDNYDFISTILTEIYSAISELTVNDLVIDKNKKPLVMVTNSKKENITTNFLKAIWNKLEDREKSHLKVLVLPIVFKMFGERTWKKEILLHGLKIFGLENFDQIDNKNLDSIFNSVMNIIGNLSNEQDNDDSKKNKISQIFTNLKSIIDALFQVNKNLEQVKDSVDSLIDILFSLPKDFKDKDGKINFAQIKKFLGDISGDETKLSAVNSMMKLFCTDENFLTNLLDAILGKDYWKANVLKHGLKFFGIRFDNLKAEDLKSVLESVTKIIDNLPDREETDEQKKQKISAITEATKTVFSILLVGKNKNKNFDGLAQNLIDILLNDDLSQVEIIDNVEKILATVKNNFVDENNVHVFKDFIKSFLNNGDFLLGIVNDVETLKPLIKNDKIEREGLTDENREKNWFVPVFENLSKLLINNIDNIGNSNDICDCIGKILDTYKNFTKAIDIPVSAETCKTAFFDNSSSILKKINAVGSVKQRYDALNNFIKVKNKFVKDNDKDKDDFKQVEKKYNAFIQEFNNSDIILTEDEQKIFDKFRFTFEVNQIAAVDSVQEILKTINAVFDNTTGNNRDKSLSIVKDLFKSIIKDGRILKFITNSDELKPIRSILGDAFEKLAALIEIKIDAIENSDSIDSFIANDMSVLLDSYKKFAAALDKDSKNNPNYQGDIIESIEGMINCVQDNFLIKDNPQSQNAYKNLVKVFFHDIESKSSNSFIDSVKNSISSISNFLIGESDDTDKTNILTFVIDKIDNESMNKNSKTALKKSLLCLMPLIRNSVDKNDFSNKLNNLFDSYKKLAEEIDKPFDFKVAKEFVNSRENQSKYNDQINQENLSTAFIKLGRELNKDVPSIKNIMHQYKLFRNEIEKIAKTGNKNFNLTEDQKNIFEGFELDQSKAISAIKNILISISNFCPSDKKIKNENNIMNENDIDNKNNISVNNNVINVNIHDQDNELNNDNEKPFNKVLINLLQGGNFLKDIINEIDSDDDADMSDDLKKYLANLSSPLCGFLISYLEQTKDIPQKIITKFDFILSKYLEITNIIKAEKVKIVELLDDVESLLIYLNGNIVNENDDVFNSYKNLWAEIFKSGQLINVFVDEVKKNFTNEQSNKYEKYLNFVTQAMPAFAYVISKISQNTQDHNFFSSWISKFKSLYLIFNNKKLLKEENNYDLNETIISQNLSENKLFNCLIDMLEFDRTDDDDMFLRQTTNDGNIISTNQEQSNLPINDNADGNKKIYLSETLFSDCWTITKYILKKYFKALKSYIQGTQNDNEILKILNDKINLQDPLREYITFLSMTNFLFLRESKCYYLAVVGEIILSCTIGLPFVIPSGVYSIGNWIYRQINAPKNRSESEILQILSTSKLDESKLYVNVNSGHQNIPMDTNKENRN